MLGASLPIFCSPACLKESVFKQSPSEEFLIHATCSESGSDRNLLENRLSGAALFSLRGCPAPPPFPQGSEPRFPQKLAFSHPLLPAEERRRSRVGRRRSASPCFSSPAWRVLGSG